jgi:hypothetical protein
MSALIGTARVFPLPAGCHTQIANPRAQAIKSSPKLSSVHVSAAGGPVAPPSEWFQDPGFYVGDPRLVRVKASFQNFNNGLESLFV